MFVRDVELDACCPDSLWPLTWVWPLSWYLVQLMGWYSRGKDVWRCTSVWIWNSKLGMMTTRQHPLMEITMSYLKRQIFLTCLWPAAALPLWFIREMVSVLLSYRNRLSEVCHCCLLDLLWCSLCPACFVTLLSTRLTKWNLIHLMMWDWETRFCLLFKMPVC